MQMLLWGLGWWLASSACLLSVMILAAVIRWAKGEKWEPLT